MLMKRELTRRGSPLTRQELASKSIVRASVYSVRAPKKSEPSLENPKNRTSPTSVLTTSGGTLALPSTTGTVHKSHRLERLLAKTRRDPSGVKKGRLWKPGDATSAVSTDPSTAVR